MPIPVGLPIEKTGSRLLVSLSKLPKGHNVPEMLVEKSGSKHEEHLAASCNHKQSPSANRRLVFTYHPVRRQPVSAK